MMKTKTSNDSGRRFSLMVTCMGLLVGHNAQADIFLYQDNDGRQWLTNTKIQGKKIKLVAKYGSPAAPIPAPAPRKKTTTASNRYGSYPDTQQADYIPTVASLEPRGCGQWSAEQVEYNAQPHLPMIKAYARSYGVEENLVRALIRQESCFYSKAVSPVGARGLMQLMPGTAKMMGMASTFEPSENIHGGVKYLAQMLQRFNGNKRLALAGYNAGPGAVDKHGGIPPYRETQNYVVKVMEEYHRLETLARSSTRVGATYYVGKNTPADSAEIVNSSSNSFRRSPKAINASITRTDNALLKTNYQQVPTQNYIRPSKVVTQPTVMSYSGTVDFENYDTQYHSNREI